jgi:hypothetical protein
MPCGCQGNQENQKTVQKVEDNIPLNNSELKNNNNDNKMDQTKVTPQENFEFKDPIQQKLIKDPKTSLSVIATVLQKDDPQIAQFAKKHGIKYDPKNIPKSTPIPPENFKNPFFNPGVHPSQLGNATALALKKLGKLPITQNTLNKPKINFVPKMTF